MYLVVVQKLRAHVGLALMFVAIAAALLAVPGPAVARVSEDAGAPTSAKPASRDSARAGARARSLDAVESAVVKAQRRHDITPAQRRYYLREWRLSLRAQRQLGRRGSSGRVAQIQSVRDIAFRLAGRHLLKADRMPTVFANVHATVFVMQHRAFPSHEDRIRLPGDPVVYGYYQGQGVQVQPLFTFANANVQYLLHQDAELIRIADRMAQLSTIRNGYRTWEYFFPYAGGSPPWVSGMAQATGMQVFARAWERTGNTAYLRIARGAAAGFGQSAANGGFSARQGTGYWYLLYGFNPHQRILNGHLQALIGLNDYVNITNDAAARVKLNQGVDAVLPMLRKFDTGAWSRYQLGQDADLNYHDLMTTQLTKLGNRLGVVKFSDRAYRFATYRHTAPQIIVRTRRFLPVYPVRDGWRDSVGVRWFVDKQSRVVIRIKDRSGRTVRMFEGSYGRGNHSFAWDGWTSTGRIARAGAYSVHMSATDIVGNRRVGQLTRVFTVQHDTTDPLVNSLRVRPRGAGRSQVVLSVQDSFSPYVTIRVIKRGKVIATKTVRGRRAVLVVNRAPRQLRGSRVFVTDTSGNRTIVRV